MKFFDGTEVFEVSDPVDASRCRSSWMDHCPPDSDCMRARLEYLKEEPTPACGHPSGGGDFPERVRGSQAGMSAVQSRLMLFEGSEA